MPDKLSDNAVKAEAAPRRGVFTHGVWLWMLATLLLGASMTAISVNQLDRYALRQAMTEYAVRADQATRQLQTTIDKETTLVFALQGLFETSGDVTRTQFRDFIRRLHGTEMFPHVYALTWLNRVARDEVSDFEQRVRLDDSLQEGGYPGFSVKPSMTRSEGYVVTYREPVTTTSAFGYDLASNPVRRQSIEQARDSGQALATAPIRLMHAADNGMGFLMMLPVYQGQVTTLAERQAQFRGLVMAVFNIGQLISDFTGGDFLRVSAHDVTDLAATPSIAMPEWNRAVSADDLTGLGEPFFVGGVDSIDVEAVSLARQVRIGGRTWQLVFTESEDALTAGEFMNRLVFPLLGGLSTLLAVALVGYLASANRRSQRMAERLTLDLQQANEELRQANREVGQFAHMASHDLQTPVRQVLGLVDMLEDIVGEEGADRALNPLLLRYLQKVRDSASRMHGLIRDLLAYAEGSQAPQLQPVDLNRTMARVIETTRDQCQRQQARVDVDALPTVLGDDQQLQRVFTNLVTNALKYSHDGQSPTVRIAANDSVSGHEIRVQDNGVGIDPAHHASIFEPFKRLHRQDEIEGTGLGLAICQQIVVNHGGEIAIESSSDNGTTILMRLPSAA